MWTTACSPSPITTGKPRVYWKDSSFEASYRHLESKLPGHEIEFVSHTTDENVWIVNAHSDIELGEVYLFDRKARKLNLQYRVQEEIPRQALSEQKPIRYKSSDGLEIPAYLTLPRGLPAKDLKWTPRLIQTGGGRFTVR